jgi:magnesium chelatase subunit H
MTPKLTLAAEAAPVRIVIVTMDDHLAGAAARAARQLRGEGIELTMHAAAGWKGEGPALERCRAAIGEADIVIASMLFMEEHIEAVLPALKARRDDCAAMVCFMSAPEVTRLTRMGKFEAKAEGGPLSFLKKLRGKPQDKTAGSGARQLKMLKRVPQFLRFIPGKAQDLRAWFLSMQYWLAGTEQNTANLARMLTERYVAPDRRGGWPQAKAAAPVDYPEVGLWHPRLVGIVTDKLTALPPAGPRTAGTVGLLIMRSYVLAGNTAHYEAVIGALEAKGLRVIPAFASGLDARPAVERFFLADGRPQIDALVSLTGFSLVGGPAYNDSAAAEDMLRRLDVPYIAAQPMEFETLEEWRDSARGLMPVEQTIMVAIPELDGATGPMVFAGRRTAAGPGEGRDMAPEPERVDMLARRVAKLVGLRRSDAAKRKLAIVLFCFPPNAGAVGTAAYLSVFRSLFNTLKALKIEGYAIDMPRSEEALKDAILGGNAQRYGSLANVHQRITADEHVRREPHLAEIEKQWGPAPGRQQSDGGGLHVLGQRFGNVFVGVQPAFGYEGDPMRLLFEQGFAPTHAFSAFYRFIREDFGADAVLHFGTHGALEFMPGKQCGLSASCWPDRLIGDLPNLYLYAANNPSEGTLAKRRSAATLVSHLTPPVVHAGLYRGLLDLKASLGRWRGLPPEAPESERADLADLIRAQAEAVDLDWPTEAAPEVAMARLVEAVTELETTLIPHGLHVVGEDPPREERVDLLLAVADAAYGETPHRAAVERLVDGASAEEAAAVGEQAGGGERMFGLFRQLADTNRHLGGGHEIAGLLRAAAGRFVPPAPSGDLLRTPAILPAGRNLHGFDPFRIPSAFAMADGAAQAERLLQRHLADGHGLPQSVAIVLWGSDNLKSEGGPIAQALSLMGAEPRFDGYGRLSGARLKPLAELGRPRIDVVITLSGIFRDLLPLQTKLLAEAAWLAASADEPSEQNFVRKHALRYAEANGCGLEEAALRVFSNAESAYGGNVNHLIDSGDWSETDELAETFSRRKCHAYGRQGEASHQPALFGDALSHVELAFQNLESVETGVTTLDQYVDALGGLTRTIQRAGGRIPQVYISDQTRSQGVVRTLAEQVAIETRTRVLNPKWYEAMLSHGHEGVRHIECAVTNTLGWSATADAVAPWVYQRVGETFVLDPAMRERLAAANPASAARLANRLLEANERSYWSPDAATLEALRRAGEELEDRFEGVAAERAA